MGHSERDRKKKTEEAGTHVGWERLGASLGSLAATCVLCAPPARVEALLCAHTCAGNACESADTCSKLLDLGFPTSALLTFGAG